RKGETSGNTLTVTGIRIDCDQDAIQLKVRVGGKGAACHTGARSCFYRALPVKPSVKLSADNPVKLTPAESSSRRRNKAADAFLSWLTSRRLDIGARSRDDIRVPGF